MSYIRINFEAIAKLLSLPNIYNLQLYETLPEADDYIDNVIDSLKPLY